jgi:hypothetical protein
MGEKRNAYRVLERKAKGKRSLGSHNGYNGMDWINLAKDMN